MARALALADLAFEPFAQAEIARLEEQRIAALEARVEATWQSAVGVEVTATRSSASSWAPAPTVGSASAAGRAAARSAGSALRRPPRTRSPSTSCSPPTSRATESWSGRARCRTTASPCTAASCRAGALGRVARFGRGDRPDVKLDDDGEGAVVWQHPDDDIANAVRSRRVRRGGFGPVRTSPATHMRRAPQRRRAAARSRSWQRPTYVYRIGVSVD